jgi:hypothetical protein
MPAKPCGQVSELGRSAVFTTSTKPVEKMFNYTYGSPKELSIIGKTGICSLNITSLFPAEIRSRKKHAVPFGP